MTRLFAAFIALLALPVLAAQDFVFDSIDGGELRLSAYRGGPVLVVNTASRCGYTYQYDGLQALQDRYRDQGLTVLTVPSGSFRQEFSDNARVKEFCAVNYNLTLPMTEVTPVTGRDAHPFYQWLRETTGFTPRWNFNKVLLNADGGVVGSWGSSARPLGGEIEREVKALLGS